MERCLTSPIEKCKNAKHRKNKKNRVDRKFFWEKFISVRTNTYLTIMLWYQFICCDGTWMGERRWMRIEYVFVCVCGFFLSWVFCLCARQRTFICGGSQSNAEFCLCWDFHRHFFCSLSCSRFCGIVFRDRKSVWIVYKHRMVMVMTMCFDCNVCSLSVEEPPSPPHHTHTYMLNKHCLCILCLIVFDSRVNNCRFCRYFAVWFT